MAVPKDWIGQKVMVQFENEREDPYLYQLLDANESGILLLYMNGDEEEEGADTPGEYFSHVFFPWTAIRFVQRVFPDTPVEE